MRFSTLIAKLHSGPAGKSQVGAVLIIMLLLLLVLTLLGVSAMSSSTLEQRMAGNDRDRQLAFNAAETALKWGENYVQNNTVAASAFNNTNGLYSMYDGPTQDDAFDTSWWTGSASLVAPAVSDVTNPPRVTIEYRGKIQAQQGPMIRNNNVGAGAAIVAVKVTVRATGLSNNTQVILQSYYGKRL